MVTNKSDRRNTKTFQFRPFGKGQYTTGLQAGLLSKDDLEINNLISFDTITGPRGKPISINPQIEVVFMITGATKLANQETEEKDNTQTGF